jgi:hypothetical protein
VDDVSRCTRGIFGVFGADRSCVLAELQGGLGDHVDRARDSGCFSVIVVRTLILELNKSVGPLQSIKARGLLLQDV